MTRMGFGLCVALLAAGCASGILYTEERLRQRASFDLDCPRGELTVVELDGSNRGSRAAGTAGRTSEDRTAGS